MLEVGSITRDQQERMTFCSVVLQVPGLEGVAGS